MSARELTDEEEEAVESVFVLLYQSAIWSPLRQYLYFCISKVTIEIRLRHHTSAYISSVLRRHSVPRNQQPADDHNLSTLKGGQGVFMTQVLPWHANEW
jgi:hypothetical protein